MNSAFWGRLGLRLMSAVLVTALTLELGLRLLAQKLPPAIGNDTVHIYSTRPGGMFYLDPPTQVRLCFPNDSRWALANGYGWHHRTDERGFRNPPGVGSEVVLLGDSFIYGHGLEESETLAARLRATHGWQVYNLARQGDGLVEQFLLFKAFQAELKPRRLYLFVFVNDFGDIAQLRNAQQLADPPELQADYAKSLRQRIRESGPRMQTGHWFDWFYTCRFVATLQELHNRRQEPQGPYRAALWVESLTVPEQFRPLAHYYQLILADLVKLCRQHGTEVVVIDLDTASPHPEWMASQKALSQFLTQLCQQQGIPYHSARHLFEGHPENQLPGDGHLSPRGHQALASWLVDIARPIGHR